MAREALSRGDLLLLVAVLATGGLVVALDLTYEWYASANRSWCDVNSYLCCTCVAQSAYAAIGGIPTAIVGVVGFLVLIAFAVLALRGVDRLGPGPVEMWLLLFAVVGAFVGLGLSLIEVFVIQAICLLCATGFALDLAILGVVVVLRRAPPAAGEG